MSRLVAYLLDAVRHPHAKLTRGQHQVRYAWDLGVHCWRQLMRHRAEGMAAELTYRTIFALIPVVVLGLVMFRIVGGLEEVQGKVENQLFSFFGVPEIPQEYLSPREGDQEDETAEGETTGNTIGDTTEDLAVSGVDQPEVSAEPGQSLPPSTPLMPPDNSPDAQSAVNGAEDPAPLDDTGVEPDGDDLSASSSDTMDSGKEPTLDQEAETRRQTQASIRRTLHEAASQLASIDFASIGVFGLLLFIYAAVALADSAESLFNRIYDAPSQRPIHIRLAIHWSIITLGSGLLALSLYMSSQMLDRLVTDADSNLKLFLNHSLSVAASWVLLFLLYALMPNTHVSVKAAAIGALVGALLWEAAKFGFQIYVVTALPYSALYGSLGLIPLFLFWIYLTWLIVLFGLILTYTLQTLRGRRFDKSDWQTDEGLLNGDPDWMLPIMSEVARTFAMGQSIDNQELADTLGLSSRVVHEMTVKLTEGQLLRKVSSGAGEEDSLTLARPAEQIQIAEILTLAHCSQPTSDHPAWKSLARLKQAEREAAKDKTLADIWQRVE